MRILFCIDSLTGGGAEKLLLRYINILQNSRGYDLTLFVINGYGALMDCLPKNIQVFIGSELSDIDALKFDNLTFDIEIGFLEGRAIKFIAIRNTSAIKVGWIHTDMLNNNWCFDYYKEGTQELMYNIMDYIVCVSGYCAQQFHVAFSNIKQSKILICNNVLDFHELDKIKKHEPNQLELENGTVRLCFVGRLTQEKHPDVAIAAINYLIKQGFNAKLDILGEGYMYDELNMLIKYYNLDTHVRLLGYHPKPYRIISDHNLLISISDIEGAPLNIAEAYYLGIPIISSHSGGSDDFANRFGGLTYTDISPDVLAEKISNLFEHQCIQYYLLRSQIKYELIKEQFGVDALLSLFDNWSMKIQSGHTAF